MNSSRAWVRRAWLGRLADARVTLAGALGLLRRWGERARQRRALERLDEARLSDLGLTPEDVRRETAKRFWQA